MMKKDLAIQALDMAVRLRNPPKGCIFHSDRGSLCCAYDYQKKLQAYGPRPSMSGKGNCYDNASVETFFKTIKAELIWRQNWLTCRQAETAIFQYINGFYNARRRYSYLGGISPWLSRPRWHKKREVTGTKPLQVHSHSLTCTRTFNQCDRASASLLPTWAVEARYRNEISGWHQVVKQPLPHSASARDQPPVRPPCA